MNIEILHSPGNAAAKVMLETGEKIIAESGAMIAMSKDMEVTTSTRTKGKGGFLKGVKRMFAGESLFLNTFTAPSGGGEVYLSPDLRGDIIQYNMDGAKEMIVQGSSFVACDDNIDMDTTWQGMKSTFLSGESIFWLTFKGTGPLLLNSFGGVYEKEIDGEYIVDTGHIVAFENTLQFEVRKVTSSILASIFSGEGFICHFKGKGRLFCQTHQTNSYGRILGPMLKPRE